MLKASIGCDAEGINQNHLVVYAEDGLTRWGGMLRGDNRSLRRYNVQRKV